ncbi:MAG: helix-turn-helix transcriptional regulator [Alphaproteobacteria bacterium]|nr:helix-turn-helix transcriptional regulator [Alphaproteobacteria bacterium]
MDQLRFTIPEMLSLLGVCQCVYILVYILFRASGHLKRVVLPVVYFSVLGAAFFMDFAQGHIRELTPYYDFICWLLWAYGPPLSALLIIQMARIAKLPPWPAWSVLVFVPLAYFFSRNMVLSDGVCTVFRTCPEFWEWQNLSGLVAGALSLLVIWAHRGVFSEMYQQKAGQERYWLVLALIFVNISFLGAMLVQLDGGLFDVNAVLVRTILGLSFIYLVTTSLFRIYPQALALTVVREENSELGVDEVALAQKIEGLLQLEKIYQEANYSRSDLAREIEAPEAVVSRVINLHFGKSFPKLLNEYRVEDAKRLLLETDAGIKIVAEEVGFNSLPSFNRVFKDAIGQSPSEYRKNMIK